MHTLLFKSTPGNETFTLKGHFDLALSMHLSDPYSGRLDFIIYRRCGDVVHPLYWGLHKLVRVVRSSTTPEILAAAETADVLLHLQVLLKQFYFTYAASVVTNSKVTLELSTSIQATAGSLNKVGLETIKEAFRPIMLSAIRWCPGSHHADDTLTKNNRVGPHICCTSCAMEFTYFILLNSFATLRIWVPLVLTRNVYNLFDYFPLNQGTRSPG